MGSGENADDGHRNVDDIGVYSKADDISIHADNVYAHADKVGIRAIKKCKNPTVSFGII